MRNLIRLTALAGATAGTLALAGGIASAAPAPQLSGPYSVTLTRTASQGLTGQPVGQTASNLPWTAKQTCTSPTSCTTLLKWTGLSLKPYQYKSTLTHTSAWRYDSSNNYFQTCRGHKGAKISQGWYVTQKIKLVGSHKNASGIIDHFTATISKNYQLSPVGAGGGCSAAQEVLSAKV